MKLWQLFFFALQLEAGHFITRLPLGQIPQVATDVFRTANGVVVITPTPVNSASVPFEAKLYFAENSSEPGALFRFENLSFYPRPFHSHAIREYQRAVVMTKEIVATRIEKQSLPSSLVSTSVAIDESWLRQHLKEFSGELPFIAEDGSPKRIPHRGSKANKDLAREWLSLQFSKLGYSTSLHHYATGINFIAEKKAHDDAPWILVTAHLDSVNNSGADDNGSGIVTGLGALASMPPVKVNLRFVGFDEEENGLVGSRAYAQSLSIAEKESILGVVNLEMTGWDKDQDGKIHVIHCDDAGSKKIAEPLERHPSDFALEIEDACTNRSDHASFWNIGVPAIVISQNFFGPEGDANPCYHRSCDMSARLNFGYMDRIHQLLTRGLRDLALESE